jgi:hypothetical protein
MVEKNAGDTRGTDGGRCGLKGIDETDLSSG